ncbi:MAG TPA: CHASE3 domain-containing protein [Stellaceae bacterium]|nr:CHASE3 domain-containing protein [Stellaceae bacterium]
MPISRLSVIRITIASILVGLVALLAIVGVNLWLVHRAAVFADRLNAARGLRSAVVDTRDLLINAETGQRGFLVTGDVNYLGPFDAARKGLPDQLARLRGLTANDDRLHHEWLRLAGLANDKLTELEQTIDLWQAGQHDAALAVVNTNLGKSLMDQARDVIAAMQDQIEATIQQAIVDQNDAIADLEWVTLIGAAVILIVVGGSVRTVITYTRQLVAAQREVTALNVGLEERVKQRTSDLGRANEEIQRFAYIVTHDLRAPLVNIMGFTAELDACLAAIKTYIANQLDDTNEAQQAKTAALKDLPEAITFIRSSTTKMDGLINAILKLSREGRRVLRPEPIELDGLLKNAADGIQHRVTEAGGKVEIDTKVPRLVSDRLALEQIFGNLLDNAVKYRDRDRPLNISIHAAEDRGHRIVVEVKDNGRGIAKQDHERVFEIFRRSGAPDQPGEGIGLAHVRTMVRNLGGDITLQSEVAQGTTMRVDLPRDLRTVLATQAQGA